MVTTFYINSQTGKLHLNDILHVPQASKSHISVNCLARDNNTFVEFHPNHFLIKEHQTKKVLHRGRCEGGLYPFQSMHNKQGLAALKPSNSLWHHRLGHASTFVVQHVLSRHNLQLP